jgi:hypothetical protein
MLKATDLSGVFPRGVGLPDPFLLLDSHGSRFDLPFLEYINNEEHKWWACMGMPYGANKWQVGDSSQQNGSFKMEIERGKMELLQKRLSQDTNINLQKSISHGCCASHG